MTEDAAPVAPRSWRVGRGGGRQDGGRGASPCGMINIDGEARVDL